MYRVLVLIEVKLSVSRENLSSGPTQIGHGRWLEACNFGLRKKRECTIYVAKNKGADQLRGHHASAARSPRS